MLETDWVLPMVVGGVFIVFGLVGIVWGKREQESYDDHMASHHDLREFMDRWPPHPEPGALRIGGWVAVAIGIIMLVLGVTFLLRG